MQKEIQARNLELPETRKMQFRIGINLGNPLLSLPDVLASYFRRHLKPSSPQMPAQDKEIISAVLAGSLSL